MNNIWIHITYMLASILFILGLKGLTSVRSARKGNWLASGAMLLAILAALIDAQVVDFTYVFVGILAGGSLGFWLAINVKMTEMPQMVAIFNGMGGAASLMVALSHFYAKMVESGNTKLETAAQALTTEGSIAVFLSILIGGVTLSGSVIAWGKLKGVKFIPDQPLLFKGQHLLNATLVLSSFGMGYLLSFYLTGSFGFTSILILLCIACLALGALLVLPIGGADQPVVISLLNSYSGLAAAMTGFVIDNNLLIISGSLVGASGLILTYIMCEAMNRSLTNVLFGGFGAEGSSGPSGADAYSNIVRTDPEDAALLLDVAQTVIIVPGYGMAVAQAQHAVKELTDVLVAQGKTVKFAIHPVAGRMPGHMNVLLAESKISYDLLFEMEVINAEFKSTDLAIVLGANDVVNPLALDDKNSPIYGMPILHVHEARNVIVVKRSLSPGFAKIPNPLFDLPNTKMFFSDGKVAIESAVRELKNL